MRLLFALNRYIDHSFSRAKIYLRFSYYSCKNGYFPAGFWFLMASISGLLLLPLLDVFEDMAAIYLDPVSHDIIGRDMFKDDE